ncbi:GNAT family N-acetyltransferase [Agreia sp.]|uniref:GNAT family N-acetyltransferase n=1 Tax=Agreia sp. TaxID=1872416 RepID=UPI0035BC4217
MKRERVTVHIDDVRRAEPSDAHAIAEVIHYSTEDAMPWLGGRNTLEEDRWWASHVLLHKTNAWVATVDGNVVGVVALHDGWLSQLFVRTTAQGFGVGHRLIEVAKRESPQGLQLWAFQRNAVAIRFLESVGFSLVREGWSSGRHSAGDAAGEPDMLYRWVP